MANVIVGTAGHIDHGKTTLIKRLTGIDTDRLKEEKKRGITIDLGFAYFDLPSGKRAGIVDVPGHEKFIKNMLAGAGGIDIVLLVVSAEEGFMPQTREHFDILSLLDVKKGIVVLTKADLVDEDWLSAVKDEVRDNVKNSFLQDSPIIEVSSVTGMGMDNLVSEIDRLVGEIEEKSDKKSPRLPIDRVFTLTGFGTVVTGTLLEGSISEGDMLLLYPSGKEARVRKIQVHGKDEPTAYAGQRVAVNIANLSKDEISRGDILAKAGTLKESSILDATLKVLDSYSRKLKNWQRLRLYHGTREVMCRLVLLDKEELSPGEESFVQFRLEEKTACKYGEHFVVRLFSPLETVGGGRILDPNANKHKRFKDEIIEELMNKSEGETDEIVLNALYKLGRNFADKETIAAEIGMSSLDTGEILSKLIEEGQVVLLTNKFYASAQTLSDIESDTIRELSQYHEKNPLRAGESREEIRSKILKGIKGKLFDEILSELERSGHIIVTEKHLKLKGFEVKLDKRAEESVKRLISEIEKGGFNPASFPDLAAKAGITQKDKGLLEYVRELEDIIFIDENIAISAKSFDSALAILRDHFSRESEISLGTFRDLLQTSRKIAVPLLERLDEKRITVRKGDIRVKGNL